MFNAYIRHVWPWHRLLVTGLAKRCKTCLLSEKATTLYDEAGICAECMKPPESPKYTPRKYGLFPLDGCALLMSGGKDSCYLLSKLGMDVKLAIFVDNGFTAPQAMQNARDVCKRFEVDLLVINSHVQHLRHKMRKAFLQAKETNGTAYDVVDFTDGKEVFEVGRRMAYSLGLKVVACGLSREQLAHYDGLAIHRDNLGALVSPLAEWNPTDDAILDELGQHGFPRKRFDPSVTNHKLIPVMCAVDVLRHGYCSFEKEFANRIRKGECERLKWLHTFEFLEYAVKRGLLTRIANHELSKLGLTLKDVV